MTGRSTSAPSPRAVRLAGVRARVHPPAAGARVRAGVVLAPGAAGDPDHPSLLALATALARAGHPVVRVAWAHHRGGRRGSPPAERAVDPFLASLTAARRLVAAEGWDVPRGWIVGGRSFGARVASLAVARDGGSVTDVRGLVLLAYPARPLRPPTDPSRATPEARTAHWSRLDVPVLLVVGDRDPAWDASVGRRLVRRVPAPVTVITIAGADHALAVSARHAPDGLARDPAAAVAGSGERIVAWARSLRTPSRR